MAVVIRQLMATALSYVPGRRVRTPEYPTARVLRAPKD